MNSDITDISSLSSLLDYIKRCDTKDICVFFDWDDTIINPETHTLIEPEITKELFSHLRREKIPYAIITARYQHSLHPHNLIAIRHNIITTMHPTLNILGIDLVHNMEYADILNEKGEKVGILFMGIFFSGKKGETMKSYMKQIGSDRKVLFVDDYEPFLKEVDANLKGVKSFRRKITYRPSYVL